MQRCSWWELLPWFFWRLFGSFNFGHLENHFLLFGLGFSFLVIVIFHWLLSCEVILRTCYVILDKKLLPLRTRIYWAQIVTTGTVTVFSISVEQYVISFLIHNRFFLLIIHLRLIFIFLINTTLWYFSLILIFTPIQFIIILGMPLNSNITILFIICGYSVGEFRFMVLILLRSLLAQEFSFSSWNFTIIGLYSQAWVWLFFVD